jgi:phage terminase small subunit
MATPTGTRPAPPAHLPAAARELWQEATSARPADFFDRASLPVLEMYCRSTAEYRRLMTLAEGMDPLADPAAFGRVARTADMHAARASQAATRLRLTHQSTLTPRAGMRAAGGAVSADEIARRYREGA